jgi:colicin import membrane protein
LIIESYSEQKLITPVAVIDAKILDSAPILEFNKNPIEQPITASDRAEWLRQIALAQKQKLAEIATKAQLTPAHSTGIDDDATQIQTYQQAIVNKIRAHWLPALRGQDHAVCSVEVRLNKRGRVISVHAIEPCEASVVFKQSVINAVQRANPLPVPTEPRLFQNYFKVFIFSFDSE